MLSAPVAHHGGHGYRRVAAHRVDENQVDVVNGLSEESGVAHYLNSSLNKAALQQVVDDVHSGRTKLLYVAPESLNKEDNIEFSGR